jgi:hypothetical protein
MTKFAGPDETAFNAKNGRMIYLLLKIFSVNGIEL